MATRDPEKRLVKVPAADDHEPYGTCDWGGCDEEVVRWRYSDEIGTHLPVCSAHSLEAENARLREQADALADALRNQGLLQNSPNGVIWHVHDCPASFDFAECNYRCRVAREAFALAGTEPYVSQETRRDTEVYE